MFFNSRLKIQDSKLTEDWHSHILPDIDDGPTAIEESVRMASLLQKAGFTTIYCTPHLIKGIYEADNATVLSRLAALQARLDAENIAIKLLPGREHYMDEFFADYLKEALPLGDTRFILVEIPDYVPAEFVRETCYSIRRRGYIPMIAHPERCTLLAVSSFPEARERTMSSFNAKPKTQHSDLLFYLKEIGCAFQGNLGSFSGQYGESVRSTAERLRADGCYTHYGTDLHSSRNFKHVTTRGGHMISPLVFMM